MCCLFVCLFASAGVYLCIMFLSIKAKLDIWRPCFQHYTYRHPVGWYGMVLHPVVCRRFAIEVYLKLCW